MSCDINIVYSKPKDELIKKLRQAILDQHGQFEGDESKGDFQVITQIGEFRASYLINQDNVSLNVKKKPIFISCQKIEDEIKKYINSHQGVGNVKAETLDRIMILESISSVVIWEQHFQKEVCVNIPIAGRKCVSITASVRLIEENNSYFVEIELFRQRVKYQLLSVCYDVFQVAIASIKVCTTNIVFENDKLKSLNMTVDGCIDTEIVGIPIKQCWTLLQQEIKFFAVSQLSVSNDFLTKTEKFESHLIGIGSIEPSHLDEEYLSSAYCHFITYDGGNDKDDNSKIELSFKLKYGASGVKRIIADSPMQSHGRFPDGDDRNVDLQVKGKIELNDILNNPGEFEINFEPNGDDTWKFHYAVMFGFSNGTTLEMKNGRNKELSDHNRTMIE